MGEVFYRERPTFPPSILFPKMLVVERVTVGGGEAGGFAVSSGEEEVVGKGSWGGLFNAMLSVGALCHTSVDIGTLRRSLLNLLVIRFYSHLILMPVSNEYSSRVRGSASVVSHGLKI